MTYVAPDTVPGVLAAIASDPEGTLVMGGGTVLEPMMTAGGFARRPVVALWRAGLSGIDRLTDETRFGATTRLRDVASTAALPSLSYAAGLVGGPAVRNRATIGGNVASGCGDLLVPLLSLGAKVVIAGDRGFDECPIDQLLDTFRLPASPERAGIPPDRVVTAVVVPHSVGRTAYVKIARRRYNTPTVAAASAVATFDSAEGGVITVARVALRGLSSVPSRARQVEDFLLGQPIVDDVIDKAVELLDELGGGYADAVASAWYRRRMAKVALSRALSALK